MIEEVLASPKGRNLRPEGQMGVSCEPPPHDPPASTVSFPGEVRSGVPVAQRFSCILSALDGFFCYNIK